MRHRRILLTASLLALSLTLGGCETFDPTEWFAATKKPLPGDRKDVFPGGTPGVPQGVPAELVEGYKAPPPEPPPQAAEEKPKPKPKPKPRPKPQQAAAPPEPPPPSAGRATVTVAPQQQQQAPAQPFPDPPRR